jgi:hypothetical protein
VPAARPAPWTPSPTLRRAAGPAALAAASLDLDLGPAAAAARGRGRRALLDEELLGRGARPGKQLVGGQETMRGQYPWAATVRLPLPEAPPAAPAPAADAAAPAPAPADAEPEPAPTPPDPAGRFCAGALVAPNAVLTSASCVAGLSPAEVRALDVRVGGVAWADAPDACDCEAFSVSKVELHPDFTGADALPGAAIANDLALIWLTATATAMPATLASAAPAPGELGALVGWGPEPGAPAAVAPRQAAVVVGAEPADACAGYPAFDAASTICVGPNPNLGANGRSGPCPGPGDAGAPLFAPDSALLFGVVSWVGAAPGDPPGGGCAAAARAGAAGVAAPAARAWLSARLGLGRLPGWAFSKFGVRANWTELSAANAARVAEADASGKRLDVAWYGDSITAFHAGFQVSPAVGGATDLFNLAFNGGGAFGAADGLVGAPLAIPGDGVGQLLWRLAEGGERPAQVRAWVAGLGALPLRPLRPPPRQ